MIPSDIDKNLFFQHTDCDYFPCHEGVPIERFNCLLCYCPLYTLGEACGGNYSYTAKGTKNCKECAVPHNGDAGVRLVKSRFHELAQLAAQRTPTAGQDAHDAARAQVREGEAADRRLPDAQREAEGA